MAAMAVGLWVALAAFLVALLYDFSRRRPKLNLPPGPPGMPLLGNLLLLSGSRLPHHVLADLSKKYGPLMFLKLGSTPCVVASSPEAFRQILKDEDKVFASRPKNLPIEQLLYHGRGLIFSPAGNHWRQLRKVATLELMTQKRINEFEGLRVAEAAEMVRALHHHSTLHGSGKPVDLRAMLKALAFNFTTQICCSKRYYKYPSQPQDVGEVAKSRSAFLEINPEEAKEFDHLIDQVNILLGAQYIGDFIPSLSFVDRLSGATPKMKKVHKRLDEFLGRIVEEHRKNPKPENSSHDFVDVLLRLPGEDGDDHLDETVIKAACLEVFAAGTHTSTTSVEWIMTEVIRNPEIAAKLQAELDAVVGKERLVTEADIPKLPYLQAVVKEGMRFHAVVPLLVPHETLQQSKIMGYDIPKGTTVLSNVYAMQRDPAVWDNPMAFMPERFLDNPEIDVKGQHYNLLPFGSGRRGCAAMSLGLTIVQYGLARLLQAFDWSPPKGMRPEDIDIDETLGMSLSRANNLEAIATPRLASSLY